MADNHYDAIVVGSGISGGWAAKELTEKGLKVLMLERGRNIEHVKDYVNAMKEAWDFPHRNRPTQAMKADFPERSWPSTRRRYCAMASRPWRPTLAPTARHGCWRRSCAAARAWACIPTANACC